MSAQQLKRVEDECARLEQELKRLDEAIHTKEACEQCVRVGDLAESRSDNVRFDAAPPHCAGSWTTC